MRFLLNPNRRRKPASSRRLRYESLERRNLLVTFTVSTAVDEIDVASVVGTGLSLREAIGSANTNADADTITFDPVAFDPVAFVGAKTIFKLAESVPSMSLSFSKKLLVTLPFMLKL